MYKNQLQELAQRSCFNLPSYACMREGPDHAPRFKATVNFNGEVFESPNYCSTLRQAEHAAAEVALNVLSTRGPARSLAARVLDETGVYKNLLQETTHRAGLSLPAYTTVRSGPGHLPVFTCTVDIAGISFIGEPAKTKKQAEKNAAMAAWSALKHCMFPTTSQTYNFVVSAFVEIVQCVVSVLGMIRLFSFDDVVAHSSGSSSFSVWDAEGSEEKDQEQEQEQITIARFLANLVGKDGDRHHYHHQQQRRRILQSQREKNAKNTLISFQGPRFLTQHQQQSRIRTLPTLPPPPPAPAPTGSKLLPFIRSIFPQKAQQSQQHETISASASQSQHPRVASTMGTLATYSNQNQSTTPRVMQIQVKTRQGTLNTQDPPIPLEEHQRDEDEWLNGASASSTRDNNTSSNNSSWNWANAITAFASGNISTPSYSMQTPHNFNFPCTHKSSSTVIQSNANSYGRPSSSSVCLRTPTSSLASPVRIRSTVPVCSAPPPRRMMPHDVSNEPNFVVPSQRSAAPAVCIRSVIPVCSAPSVPPGFSSRDHEAQSSQRAQTDGNEEREEQSDETRSRMMLRRLHL